MLLGRMTLEPVHVREGAETRQARLAVIGGELKALLVWEASGAWRVEAAFGERALAGPSEFTSLEAFCDWMLPPRTSRRGRRAATAL